MALLPLLLLVSSPASAAASSLSFGPCPKGTAFQCTRLPVPLDRTGALPGTVSLDVERRLAGATPSRTAVVALAGGPGQAATPYGELLAQTISPALASRDLLVFDQRGTGESGALSCAALSGSASVHLSLAETAEHCAAELGPARGDYTTSESVADIEALRQAGEYEKLVLYGTSYGTKVALEYAERYPQNVEALVLDSTELPNGPEAFHLSTFKAMTPALRELCSHDACAGVTRTPVGDLAQLVTQLSKHPLAGEVYLPSGKALKIKASANNVYELLLDGDLNPLTRAEVPAAIRSALQRDPEPLLHLLLLNAVGTGVETTSDDEDGALFDATTCEETPFPWQRTAPLEARLAELNEALNAIPPSAFYPFGPEAGLLDQTIPTCVAWPDAAPAPPAEAALPNVPTLILSGGQDLRTPTENSRAVAKLIPDSQVLVVPYTGHSVIESDPTACARDALAAFFADAPVHACPIIADPFPPAPIAPPSLSTVALPTGIGGLSGHTLAAAVDTIRNLTRSLTLLAFDADRIPTGDSFGGLRGGGVKVAATMTVLNRFSYVPGVQLSGAIPTTLLLEDKGAAAKLTVTGTGDASGHLRISQGGHLAGILAGRRVAITLSAKASAATRLPSRVLASEWPAPSAALPLLSRPRLP